MSTKTKKTTKLYRVFIGQVNATYFDVRAKNRNSAEVKGCSQWKKYAYIDVVAVEEQKDL